MSTRSPQRPVIAAAWERARSSGLVPSDRPDPTLGDISAADPLLDAARPILSRAAETLHGTPTALLLVDHRSRLVARVSADTTLEGVLIGAGAVAGAAFTESEMGTNALGTTAEVRGDLVINGQEHYLEQFRSLSCFGQPIIHPSTRRVAGILCMTQVAERLNPLSVPLVRGIVSDIAERLLSRSHLDHRQVITTFERAAERRDIAVVAVGDDLQLTNTPAAQLLSPADFGTLRVFISERDIPPIMTLVSGIVVAVEAVPIPGVRSSAIFRLRPRMESVPPAALTTPRQRGATASTVAISGEPGTGRTTAAFTIVAREEAVVIDVPGALLDGRPIDLASALRRARTLGHGVVVD
ncbi:MAG: Fis family transcriptional regulator, partial [Gordonia sp. (in: high G+C Gram-positive bacteria)]|uniref:Fis family transcriptional regulator n=1 Tax=Gordonia sp. (in: high G+C Gram-positive bacteria) TaxID=84139 RepID=UPI003BB4E6CF